jgi:hypothetical protein
MPGSRCFCPACDAVVKLAADEPAGSKITCPECDKVFRVPESEEREDRPRRRKRRPAPSGMKPVVVLLILVPVLLGGVGLVAGGGYLAWKLAQTDKEVVTVTSPNVNNNVPINPNPPAGNPRGGNPPFGGPPAGNAPAPPPQPSTPSGPTDVGALAPEIEGGDLDGNRFKLSDYRGKVVVLDFWGHW